MNIKELIFEHHSELERKEKRRITLKELARLAGIDETYFNHVYNMRRPPNEKIIGHLYDFFGDLRFYDVAGMKRPDPMLRFVMKAWNSLTETQKERIAKITNYDKRSNDDNKKD